MGCLFISLKAGGGLQKPQDPFPEESEHADAQGILDQNSCFYSCKNAFDTSSKCKGAICKTHSAFYANQQLESQPGCRVKPANTKRASARSSTRKKNFVGGGEAEERRASATKLPEMCIHCLGYGEMQKKDRYAVEPEFDVEAFLKWCGTVNTDTVLQVQTCGDRDKGGYFKPNELRKYKDNGGTCACKCVACVERTGFFSNGSKAMYEHFKAPTSAT